MLARQVNQQTVPYHVYSTIYATVNLNKSTLAQAGNTYADRLQSDAAMHSVHGRERASAGVHQQIGEKKELHIIVHATNISSPQSKAAQRHPSYPISLLLATAVGANFGEIAFKQHAPG